MSFLKFLPACLFFLAAMTLFDCFLKPDNFAVSFLGSVLAASLSVWLLAKTYPKMPPWRSLIIWSVAGFGVALVTPALLPRGFVSEYPQIIDALMVLLISSVILPVTCLALLAFTVIFERIWKRYVTRGAK